MSREFGFLYVATGRQYIEEVFRSFESLTTRFPVALITDETFDDLDYSVFCSVEILPRGSLSGLSYKVLGISSQTCFESFVFLDSDTLMFGSLDWMAELGKYCDFAAALEFGRGLSRKLDQNMVFQKVCEYNTGVLFVGGSAVALKALGRWKALYNERSLLDFHDQFSFLLAVAECRARVLVLGSECNFRANQVSIIDGDLLVLHARVKDSGVIKSRIRGSVESIGLWIPRIKVFVAGSLIDLLADSFRRLKNVFSYRR